MTHRTSWPESTGGSSGHLISIALQEEANAILVGPKQDSMLLYNALVKGAIKQKVWLIRRILNSICRHCADPWVASQEATCQFQP